MVRCTKRQLIVRKLDRILEATVKHALKLRAFGLEASHAEDFHLELKALKQSVLGKRHLHRGKGRRRKPKSRG